MLIKQTNQKSIIFVIICNFSYEPYLCNGCHDLMQKAIVSIKGNDYKTHFCYISKNDAITLMTNSNLNDKNGVL